MNSSQVSSTLDRAATVFATWFLTWLVSKKWISDTDMIAFLPILVALPAAFIGWYKNRPKSLVASVDELAKDPASPIKGVVVTNTTEGRELADSIPGSTTVVAGTPDAKIIAAIGGTTS